MSTRNLENNSVRYGGTSKEGDSVLGSKMWGVVSPVESERCEKGQDLDQASIKQLKDCEMCTGYEISIDINIHLSPSRRYEQMSLP